ncbi:MAG: branched-chain amino acid ABC transporter permease [Candidatus Eisenbacteria bacterium]|nr:branched-chain amino acid ABC transporter permease [Candidatus Eisenbacteria bacterium]
MLIQLLANGFVMGCSYTLVALGFALIYSTTRTFHFVHGAVYTLAAYLFFTLHNLWHVPLIPAALIVIVFIALFGIGIEEALYRPLVKRGSSQLIQMLSSLGLYIVLVNVVAMLYGNETKVLNPGIQATHTIGGVILTQIQVWTVVASVVLFALVAALLRFSRLGKLIRALRDDPELVSAIGVSPRCLRWSVLALGSALAAVAAMLIGSDVGIDPNIGMAAILNGAVAVIIGGVGIFEGAAIGGVAIGLLQSLAVWKFSARWQDMVTFVLLVTFLFSRPQGIFGSQRRAEEMAK